MRLLQIDSVKVPERSHYLPLFARHGDYRKNLIDDAVHGPPRKRGYFEYWAHEASILPISFQPLLRWRMAEAREGIGMWKGLHRFSREKAGFVQRVLDTVRAEGPLRASHIPCDPCEPPRRPQGNRPDGPPDLDDVWGDFNNRQGGLDGRGRGGGPRQPKRPGTCGDVRAVSAACGSAAFSLLNRSSSFAVWPKAIPAHKIIGTSAATIML